MFALTLACVLAVASAAPSFHHRHHGHSPYSSFENMEDLGFRDEYFDASQFWSQFNTEMKQLDDMLNSLRLHFSVGLGSAGVVGDHYELKLTLPCYEEKEIVVKARQGMLMVQAVHTAEDGSVKNYLDARTLPPNVDVDAGGRWGYADDVLTISFPLKGKSTEVTTTEATTEVTHVTAVPSISREEIDVRGGEDDQDADVGVGSKDTEVRTNEIPRQSVEATTYAVDLKDEVEFVPVHY